MQCPIDKTEMEQGDLANYVNRTRWASSKNTGWSKFVSSGPRVFAYRCPKCGKVELTTEVK